MRGGGENEIGLGSEYSGEEGLIELSSATGEGDRLGVKKSSREKDKDLSRFFTVVVGRTEPGVSTRR